MVKAEMKLEGTKEEDGVVWHFVNFQAAISLTEYYTIAKLGSIVDITVNLPVPKPKLKVRSSTVQKGVEEEEVAHPSVEDTSNTEASSSTTPAKEPGEYTQEEIDRLIDEVNKQKKKPGRPKKNA